ncbi:MAG: L-histidine N(alpha)-methyltransferase [Pseudohongiellaceae bacterium]
MQVSRLEQLTDGYEQEVEQFAVDVLTGFSSAPKRLSAKYFYDDVGSELFRAISQHEDYYLTRTEYDILSANCKRIPEMLAEEEVDIIELGAGDGHKSELVIDGFLQAGVRVNFFPIDISDKAMDMLGENIGDKPNLSVHGLIGDYFDGLRFVRERSAKRQLVLFLGSNIGNFDRIQNQGFLRRLWNSLNADDYVLIGFDLKKDIDKLITAYSDSSNYTRDLNLNLLARINRELGGDFDLSGFQHYAVYNPMLGAMESYLLALREQSVYIGALQREFSFTAFEPIHLEYSFKFLPADIDYLSAQTGYTVVENFTDPDHRFINSLWQVNKQANSA